MAEIRDEGPSSPALTASDKPEANLMSRAQAAEYLGLKPGTLAHWACKKPGMIPMVRVGGRCKYRKNHLDAYLARNTVGADGFGADQ
jgi:excisionase family DNA binding protein